MDKSRNVVWLLGGCLLGCLVVASACRDLPTEPSHRNPALVATCTPAGPSVSCSATLLDVPNAGSSRDVTLQATWLASDLSVGSYVRPGYFTPTRQGEVALWARYQQWEALGRSRFLVGPGQDARWLYWLAGTVSDAATGAPIAGAEVRILDGYAQGTHAVTDASGNYRIDDILTGEAFSAMASKDGYTPSTRSYRVDPPVGSSGNGPFLDFTLTPLP